MQFSGLVLALCLTGAQAQSVPASIQAEATSILKSYFSEAGYPSAFQSWPAVVSQLVSAYETKLEASPSAAGPIESSLHEIATNTAEQQSILSSLEAGSSATSTSMGKAAAAPTAVVGSGMLAAAGVAVAMML